MVPPLSREIPLFNLQRIGHVTAFRAYTVDRQLCGKLPIVPDSSGSSSPEKGGDLCSSGLGRRVCGWGKPYWGRRSSWPESAMSANSASWVVVGRLGKSVACRLVEDDLRRAASLVGLPEVDSRFWRILGRPRIAWAKNVCFLRVHLLCRDHRLHHIVLLAFSTNASNGGAVAGDLRQAA